MNTAIFGEKVSLVAKSPTLWNRAYEHFQIPNKMLKIDLMDKDFYVRFKKLVIELEIFGGLLASPLKKMQLNKALGLNIIDEIEVKNCFKFENDKINTKNFDVEAMFNVLNAKTNINQVSKLLVMGYGALGESVIEHVIMTQKIEDIFIFTRGDLYTLQNRKLIKFTGNAPIFDLILNCSKKAGPLNERDFPVEKEYLGRLSECKYIFNANYGMKQDVLRDYAKENLIPYSDGKDMNRIQAALSFNYVNSTSIRISELIKVMDPESKVEYV